MIERSNNIKLCHFSNEYLDVLISFVLPKEQKQFTALPKEMMDEIDGQYQVVILNENEPVGFFLLHSTERVRNYSDNPNAMLLTGLSINYAKQGKGYAKKGMNLLCDFIKRDFPTCNEIILAVNHKNVVAQKLYLKVGFQDTGRRRTGPNGKQFIMNLILEKTL